jgi:hypothetical protein
MKSFILWCCLSVGLGAPCTAQVPQAMMNVDLSADVLAAANRSIKDSRDYNNIMGSLRSVPGQGYFTTDWLPGTVELVNGTKRSYPGLRYNLVLRTVQVRDSAALLASGIAGFQLRTRTNTHAFETHDYQNSLESGNRDFFEALNPNGALQFFLLHQIAQKAAPAAKNTGELGRATYMRETRLYVRRLGQQRLAEFVPGRKQVLKLFGNQAAAVEAYATSKNLAYDNAQDVVWMADFYNKLVSPSK